MTCCQWNLLASDQVSSKVNLSKTFVKNVCWIDTMEAALQKGQNFQTAIGRRFLETRLCHRTQSSLFITGFWSQWESGAFPPSSLFPFLRVAESHEILLYHVGFADSQVLCSSSSDWHEVGDGRGCMYCRGWRHKASHSLRPQWAALWLHSYRFWQSGYYYHFEFFFFNMLNPP